MSFIHKNNNGALIFKSPYRVIKSKLYIFKIFTTGLWNQRSLLIMAISVAAKDTAVLQRHEEVALTNCRDGLHNVSLFTHQCTAVYDLL